jgi:hypothetical protein
MLFHRPAADFPLVREAIDGNPIESWRSRFSF